MSRLLNIVATMGLLVGERQAGTPRPEVPPSLQAPAGEEVFLAAHVERSASSTSYLDKPVARRYLYPRELP
ncbi:MAG TPA: hypothetical protein VH110_07065 [Candidatus Acidoferrum sp.]|nr:hypothetical protein [Candidatus Acidoferrum sp.]